jgi:hypothetical protein
VIDSSAKKAESPAHSSAKVRHLTEVAFPLRQASLDSVQEKPSATALSRCCSLGPHGYQLPEPGDGEVARDPKVA